MFCLPPQPPPPPLCNDFKKLLTCVVIAAICCTTAATATAAATSNNRRQPNNHRRRRRRRLLVAIDRQSLSGAGDLSPPGTTEPFSRRLHQRAGLPLGGMRWFTPKSMRKWKRQRFAWPAAIVIASSAHMCRPLFGSLCAKRNNYI